MSQNTNPSPIPQTSSGNQKYNFPINVQPSTDDQTNRQSPSHSNKPNDHRKSLEENSLYQSQPQPQKHQNQMKRINMAGSVELSSPLNDAERFGEREIVPSQIKGSPNDYPYQYQLQQQQMQGGPVNFQGTQAGFNPAQMKGNNMSPGYYTNPQFFPNNQQNPSPNQQFQKRKPKGMMGNNNNPNNPSHQNVNMNMNPNNQNKNFGMNPFPMNQPTNHPAPQNLNPNQYRGSIDNNKQVYDQNINQRGPNNQTNNNAKFNRNQERNFQENSGMNPQRGFMGSPNYQQHQQSHGGLINVPDLPENIHSPNEGMMEKIPVNTRNFDENKNIKGRPQQQQGNVMFKNNPNNNMMFPPGPQFMDSRTMPNNMVVQNPGMFTPPFHQQQQPQSVRNIELKNNLNRYL